MDHFREEQRSNPADVLPFESRHIGPSPQQIEGMLKDLGLNSLEELISGAVPSDIRLKSDLNISQALSEREALIEFRQLAEKNRPLKSLIGMGYVDTILPPVIQRNILENPCWYTQYTPYQAEIAQGRLEALINFQTMIIDFTALEIANASLLDEATAAAEAMAMNFALTGKPQGRNQFFVAKDCHPQTLEVLKTRAKYLGIQLVIEEPQSYDFTRPIFGALLQYPNTYGGGIDYPNWIRQAKSSGALVTLACDLMALALLKPPGEMGADFAVGNSQCFGVPMGYGGPHAAFLATRDEYKRLMPGRIVGVSKDARGRAAFRLALQTREQHIRRDKATSNICTAQVLLAIIASMYAVYHGPEGIRRIATRIHRQTLLLADALEGMGLQVEGGFFNTLRIRNVSAPSVLSEAVRAGYNLREIDSQNVGITLDETTSPEDLEKILDVFAKAIGKNRVPLATQPKRTRLPVSLQRDTPYLRHEVFSRYHSETEMLRYITRLQGKDLSLAHSMIPLGSCTMKLNATSEMLPVTWPEFSNLHPFAPLDQAEGYLELFRRLERDLSEITGFDAVSLQPNAGSQGEYAGLLAIRQYQESKGETFRDVCLIPSSAHGTNPASAAMLGMKIVVVACDREGNIDLTDLRLKIKEHAERLSALMVTYPSTHGVFETEIREICRLVHESGGQVYMDGANMNAQVGLCRPSDFGADVCHLNLHKTFCIPHGGGGPGMGPIGVKAHLAPFLPGHLPGFGKRGVRGGAVSAAPYGSPSILPISYLYIRMMGAIGLKRATQIAILNANYIAQKLSPHFPVLYRGQKGWVAHECILDLRAIKEKSGIEVEDVAKRLMDYGYHAPTISFPVAGTVMIEPTESESKEELDRFIEAMISIREEIREIEEGKGDPKNNLLKNAPHTAEAIAADEWSAPYSRKRAVYPLEWVRTRKFWPAVSRIDNVYGERNLMCACPPPEAYN